MHIPLRMCVVCREHKNAEELIRITDNNGIPEPDTNCKKTGRGAYICRNSECMKKAQKKHVIERHLSCEANDSLYDRLEELI